MHIDLDIVIYAVIAAVLLGRLWFLLGTRNDDEPQRPNPFIPPAPPAQKDETAAAPARIASMNTMPPPASLEGGLAAVRQIDTAFDEKAFLAEARRSFSAIVESYATGNLTPVSDLLSPTLLGHFQQAADSRKAAGQTAQTRVARIKEAETVAARTEGTQAFVTVKFVSDQENILRDAGGAIIGGAEGKTEEVADIWIFAKDTQQADGKWVVGETGG